MWCKFEIIAGTDGSYQGRCSGVSIVLRGLWLIFLIALSGCGEPERSFSQYPGFAQYFQAHPRSSVPPDQAARALLERFRPQIFLPPSHAGLIDFYSDYIAQGELRDGNGTLISAHVTRDELNRHKNEPETRFGHLADRQQAQHAVVYGRLDRAQMTIAGATRLFTLLTYHAVFRTSGLPAALNGWRAWAFSLVGDLKDWHQLDHYTAATVMLDESLTPIGLMLQQHNYQRTYALGESVARPRDGRIEIDAAERSNELYPHVDGRTRRRAVRWVTPESMRYLMGFGPAPMLSVDDITDGVTEASYQLQFLPQDDAFYSFQGYLGERRRLPGRDGAPGADYNTLPAWKPYAIQLFIGYFREGDHGDKARFEASFEHDPREFAHAQAEEFARSLAAQK